MTERRAKSFTSLWASRYSFRLRYSHPCFSYNVSEPPPPHCHCSWGNPFDSLSKRYSAITRSIRNGAGIFHASRLYGKVFSCVPRDLCIKPFNDMSNFEIYRQVSIFSSRFPIYLASLGYGKENIYMFWKWDITLWPSVVDVLKKLRRTRRKGKREWVTCVLARNTKRARSFVRLVIFPPVPLFVYFLEVVREPTG